MQSELGKPFGDYACVAYSLEELIAELTTSSAGTFGFAIYLAWSGRGSMHTLDVNQNVCTRVAFDRQEEAVNKLDSLYRVNYWRILEQRFFVGIAKD